MSREKNISNLLLRNALIRVIKLCKKIIYFIFRQLLKTTIFFFILKPVAGAYLNLCSLAKEFIRSILLLSHFLRLSIRRIKSLHGPWKKSTFPTGIFLLKVNNRISRTRCEVYSKSTIKTPVRRQWHRSGVFIFNFEHISHLVLVFLLLTLKM